MDTKQIFTPRWFPRSGGFTLTELLVVIAIIVILAGILMPSLQAARIQMLRTKCLNQVKEIARACTAYSQDGTKWRGSSSADHVMPSVGADTKAGLWLLLSTKGSIGRKMFLCPEAELRRDFTAPEEDDTQFHNDTTNGRTLSYSYLQQQYTEDSQTKFSTNPEFLLGGGKVIIADDNPFMTFSGGAEGAPPQEVIDRENGKSPDNSENHAWDGQNLAREDGSGMWTTDPRIEVKVQSGQKVKDHIYRNGDDNDGNGGNTGNGPRSSVTEIFVTP